MRLHRDTRTALADIGLKLDGTRTLGAAYVKDGRTEYVPVARIEHYPFVDFNLDWRVNVDVFDIDSGRLESWARFWGQVVESTVPVPSWAVRTDKGLHVAYVYSNPILTAKDSRPGPIRYRQSVRDAYNAILGADIHCANRRVRNPWYHGRRGDVRFVDGPHDGYSLADLAEPIEVQRQLSLMRDVAAADVNEVNGRRGRPRTSMAGIADLVEQARGMVDGDGRNMHIAIGLRTGGRLYHLASEDVVRAAVTEINGAMLEPMDASEIRRITDSLIRDYNKARPRRISARAWARNSRGGRRTAAKRREALIERDADLLELAGMPISQSQISALLARRGQQLHGADWVKHGYQLNQQNVSKALKRLRATGSQLL